MTGFAVDAARMSRHRRRKLVNRIALTMSLAAMAFGVFWLVWILVDTVRLGIGGLALANEFAEAGSGMHQAALIYLGLVLFFITFVVLSLSKLLLARLRRGEGARA